MYPHMAERKRKGGRKGEERKREREREREKEREKCNYPKALPPNTIPFRIRVSIGEFGNPFIS
jgi:hypothetical protein